MAGASTDSISMEIQTTVSELRSCSFSLDNGDKLFAIWNDNIAVDYDPGIATTVTLPNFSNQMMVGIDVLNGYQQELVTEVKDSNLVIRNLLVKDYPIILRTTSASVGILTGDLTGPKIYKLGNNYPNPFNLETTFHFQLPKKTHVSINIYNIKGQHVVSLVDEQLEAGNYSRKWDGMSNSALAVANGVYFYRMKAGSFIQTRKMLLMK